MMPLQAASSAAVPTLIGVALVACGALALVAALLLARSRRAGARLSVARDAWRGLADGLPLPLAVLSTTGEMIYCNPELVALVGTSFEEVRSRGIDDVVFFSSEGNPGPIDRLLTGRALDLSEPCTIGRAEAAGRWPAVMHARRLTPSGGPARVVLCFADDSERRAAEQALERALVREEHREQTGLHVDTTPSTAPYSVTEDAESHELRAKIDQLERANDELERYAHVVAHDLQQPLTNLLAYASRLESRIEAGADGDVPLLLDGITSGAERMRNLIRGLLELSDIDNAETSFTALSLHEVLDSALLDLDTLIKENEAELDIGNLPVVIGDPLQLRQLLQNLVENAIRYRRPDAPPRIEIDAEVVDDTPPSMAWADGLCVVRVRDNGRGFEPGAEERIFEPFQRLAGGTVTQGSGLGLAICRRIVERHGGTITAHAARGNGATFRITLPLGESPQAAGTSSVALRAESSSDDDA